MSVPGDKSVSHRALLLAAVADGHSNIAGINLGRDVLATARAVARLGARSRVDRAKCLVEVEGFGWDGLREPDTVLDAGNSATTLRTVAALCAALPSGAALTGDRTLRRRPMGRIVRPLRAMGARIDGRAGGELPPLWVRGGGLRGITWTTEVASAQTKTALLLAGLRASGETSVTEPRLSRDHTELMLAAAGVRLTRHGVTAVVAGGQQPEPLRLTVPGDISSAAFLLVAATIVSGSHLVVRRVGLNPTRCGLLGVLQRMGAHVSTTMGPVQGGEPTGDAEASFAELQSTEVGGHEVPSLIDEIPVLAVAATQARGTTVVRDARELRVKESDRIGAMVEGLTRLGARAEARPDGLEITGPTTLHGGVVDSHGDHRVALSFAVAGLVADGPVTIRNWDCVETSLPGWEGILAAARAGRR